VGFEPGLCNVENVTDRAFNPCCWRSMYFYAYSVNDVCFDGALALENLRLLTVH